MGYYDSVIFIVFTRRIIRIVSAAANTAKYVSRSTKEKMKVSTVVGTESIVSPVNTINSRQVRNNEDDADLPCNWVRVAGV